MKNYQVHLSHPFPDYQLEVTHGRWVVLLIQSINPIDMKRIHLFEFEGFSWFPVWVLQKSILLFTDDLKSGRL